MAANQQTIFNGDWFVNGALNAQSFGPPAGCIDDTAVEAAAGIQASKLQHQYEKVFCPLASTVTAATERRVVHVVRGTTGTIQEFRCGVVTACIGAATVTFDLKKNGTTVLTATTVLDNTNLAYTTEAAAGFTSTALVAGDVLEVTLAAAAGGGTIGLGAFAVLNLREDAQ